MWQLGRLLPFLQIVLLEQARESICQDEEHLKTLKTNGKCGAYDNAELDLALGLWAQAKMR